MGILNLANPIKKTLFFHDIFLKIPKYLCKGCSPKKISHLSEISNTKINIVANNRAIVLIFPFYHLQLNLIINK